MITYLAGAFERKEELKGYAQEMKEAGMVVSSRWLTDLTMQTAEKLKSDPAVGKGFAMRDADDIMGSRRIVVFTGEMGRGGHQWEMGFAQAIGIEVIIVGPVVNLFCLLAHEIYPTWEDFKVDKLGIEAEKEDG